MRKSFAIFIVLLIAITFSCTVNDQNNNSNSISVEQDVIQSQITSGQEVVDKLEELEYFKYCDSNSIELVKAKLKEGFDDGNYLTTAEEDSSYYPLCYRLYFLDGETLFEADGILWALKLAQRTFNRMNLQLEWTNHIENWDGDKYDHRITVNGKEYTVFEGNAGNFDAWGKATMYFVKIINDQLDLQASKERVYPISGGNDGEIIFLTSEQYQFIKTVYTDREFSPLELEKWCEQNGL